MAKHKHMRLVPWDWSLRFSDAPMVVRNDECYAKNESAYCILYIHGSNGPYGRTINSTSICHSHLYSKSVFSSQLVCASSVSLFHAESHWGFSSRPYFKMPVPAGAGTQYGLQATLLSEEQVGSDYVNNFPAVDTCGLAKRIQTPNLPDPWMAQGAKAEIDNLTNTTSFLNDTYRTRHQVGPETRSVGYNIQDRKCVYDNKG